MRQTIRRIQYQSPRCPDCNSRLIKIRKRVQGYVTVRYFDCRACGGRYRADECER
jgi:uncharacterized protein with PIN domain